MMPIYASGEKLALGSQVVRIKIKKEEFALLDTHATMVQRYLDKGKEESALAVARANALREVQSVAEVRAESAPTFAPTKGLASTKDLTKSEPVLGKDDRKRTEKESK